MRKKIRVVYILGLALLSVAAISVLIGQTAPAVAQTEQAQAGQAATLATQKDAIIQAIGAKDVERANDQCNQMLSRFASDEGLAQAAYDIAVAYGEAGQAETAAQLYRHVIERWHDSAWGIRSQRDLIHAAIERKDDVATQAALDTLLSDFAQHADAAKIIYNLAKHYHTRGDVEMAQRLHDYNVEHYPSDGHAYWSQIENVKACIAAEDDAAADAACDKLLATFSDEASLPHEVYKFGLAYTKARRPERAETFYRHVITAWPDSPHTAWARLALLDAEGRDESDPEVQAAVAQLVEVLPQQELPAKDLYKAALDLDQKQSKPQRALALKQYNANNSPQDDQYTVWSQIEVVKAHIRAGNNAAAEEAINTMLTRYADLEDLPEQVSIFGDVYTETGQYDKAEAMFSYIEQRWPDDGNALWAKARRAKSLIAQGDDKAAEAIFQKMLADHITHPRLIEAVKIMAESCWVRALDELRNPHGSSRPTSTSLEEPGDASAELRADCFRRTLAKCELIIQNFPQDSTNTPFAYHYAGSCCVQLRQKEKALEYYQAVCDTWPDYSQRWYLLDRIASLAVDLKIAGVKDEAEADLIATSAYESILRVYPNSAPARRAERWVILHQSEHGGN